MPRVGPRRRQGPKAAGAKFPFRSTGGQSRPLAGDSLSVSSTSANLTVSQKLIGDSQSLSTTSGTLTVKQALVGDSSSISSASGTLYDAEALTGDSVSVSTGSGTLSVKQALTGDSLSVSTASGTLYDAEALVGDSHSVSSASGTLTGLSGGFKQLAGDSRSVSDAFGSLFTKKPVDTSVGGGGFGPIFGGRRLKKYKPPPPIARPQKDVEIVPVSATVRDAKELATVMGLTRSDVKEIIYDHNLSEKAQHVLGKR